MHSPARDFDVVIPVHDQWAFTRQCLESLQVSGIGLNQIIIIDNASTDETAAMLEAMPEVRVLRNASNLGCAAAWNQGARAGTALWIIFLNNDTLLPIGWWEGLLEFAARSGVAVASPAMRESGDFVYELKYDLTSHACAFMQRMRGITRCGRAHGVCFAVRRDAFDAVGGFDESFPLGSHEDIDFFWRVRHAGFALGTTGASFIHHFRAVTRNALDYRAAGNFTRANRERFRRKWGLSKPKAWLLRQSEKWEARLCALWERLRTGHTLKEQWIRGRWRYR